MSDKITLLDVLREKCNPIHKALENQMYTTEIMQKTLNKQQLHDLIAINYQFFKTAETILGKCEHFKELNLERAHLAHQDLLENECVIPEVTALSVNPNNPDECIGLLYVSLGSSLGGQMIAKKIALNEAINKESYRFFAEAKDVNTQWKHFLKIAAEYQGDYDVAANAAALGFGYFTKNFKSATL